MQILSACAIIVSTAHASSVFISSYSNTNLTQSACVFSLECLLKGLSYSCTVSLNAMPNIELSLTGWISANRDDYS